MESVSLSSDETPDSGNEWTIEREKYCKQLANSRGAFVWLHNRSSKYYYILNKVFSVLIAIFSGVFAAGITIASVIPNWTDSWKVVVVFAGLTFIACVFEIVLQALELDTKSVNHSEASGKSTALFIRISREIEKPRIKRASAIKFIHSVIEEDSNLRTQMRHIPVYCLRKYYARFGKNAIPYEVLFSDHELLKIKEDLKSGDEIEVVNKAMMRMTHGIHVESHTTLVVHPPEESLEICLKEHDKQSKFRRSPPALSTQQLFDLEKYLDD